jgi:two-component system, NtrC family, response regulator AtoC
MTHPVLVIEDETVLAKNIRTYLQRHGYEVDVAGTGEAGLAKCETFRPEVVILDFNLPGINGLDVLRELQRAEKQTKVIVITGHGSEQIAVDAMKAGALDYLSKPIVLEKLKLIVDKAVGEGQREGELSYYRKKTASESGLDKLAGSSPPMLALKQLIRQVLDADFSLADSELPAVLITGETGTGKELVARALHFDGPRKDRPFVELNCAAIPAQLLEAELFGYERGAFTDAKERKLGLVETAEGGTLFLDEIGELDLSVQVKLLKLLEDKTVRRLGSVREQATNVRIIAATNRDLDILVREGKFRADLFFRLRIISIQTPPLRKRRGDIGLLASNFLAQHGKRYGKPGLTFSAEAIQALDAHQWPGNVRELRNSIEQCVVMANGTVINADRLGFRPASIEVTEIVEPVPVRDPLTLTIPPGTLNLTQVEREMLVQALQHTGWNVTRAAKLLGITRDTLRYRLEKYSLQPPV